MLTCSLIQLCVYGQTDLINNNVNTIALSDIAELIQFIPKFNTEYKGVLREIRLDNFNYMGRLLFLAGGYSCSWMVTNDPGVTLPPHRGRVSGTQGQRWWVLLLLGTAGPPTPGHGPDGAMGPWCGRSRRAMMSWTTLNIGKRRTKLSYEQ